MGAQIIDQLGNYIGSGTKKAGSFTAVFCLSPASSALREMVLLRRR